MRTDDAGRRTQPTTSDASDSDTRHQVVVGVDGSHEARHAMRWATRLAAQLHADVTAVHGLGLVERLDTRPAALRDVVEREWCRPLHHTGLAHRVEVVERPAVDALLAAADERPTDAIVVGTRGLGLTPAGALGSTALQLLCHATVPVLVVPAPADGHRVDPHRIVVAFDGSPAAHTALHWATRVATSTGATCELVAVAEESPVFPLGPAATATSAGEEHAPTRLRAMAEDAAAPLRRAGIAYRVTTPRGPAAHEVVAIARRRPADLVVVGASGVASHGNPLAGSTSRRIAHDAGRPVAVIPAPVPAPAPAPRPADLVATGTTRTTTA